MSEEEDSYCRLCAEPTSKTQLISPDDDVGLNSKIGTKMLWINIDISTKNALPNSICFSCFDLLERTWSFLNNVRSAQSKLNEIFLKKETEISSADIKADPDDIVGVNDDSEQSLSTDAVGEPDITGKPVNKDWEAFEDLKEEIKPDILNGELEIIDDPDSLMNLDLKVERTTDEYDPESDGFHTCDSDLPLLEALKITCKRKKKFKHSSSNRSDSEVCQSQTWDHQICICADCDAQCKNIMSLRLHALQIHHQCCLFKCSDCGKVLNSNRRFVNHVRTHNKALRHCCEFCNKQFIKTSALNKHRNKIHSETYATACVCCGSAFENEEQLQDHIIIYKRTIKKRTGRREKQNFLDSLKCEHCKKQFKTRSNLQQHKLIHMERSRDFSCHVCGKMFFTKGTLIAHMSTHEEVRPYKCEFCPLTFRARGNLQAHVSIHSGTKPFICEQCGKSFRVKRHLKSHSIVHTDLKPYKCNYCSKTFKFKTRLNLHLRQHTGAKPYNCVYCNRDFTNGSNYKKHMKRKHCVDTYPTKKCSSNNVAPVEVPEEDLPRAKSVTEETDT